MKSQFITIKATGNSMAPLLLDSDLITIKQVPFLKLKVDDIISFFKNKKLVSHRIVYINKNISDPYVITKGDFNFKDDGKIYDKEIMGKIVRVKRKDTSFAITSLYQFNAYYYLREIDYFLSILRRNKINYIILKGLPLYLYINNKIPNRIFADCDILIKPKNFKKIYGILMRNGYIPEYPVTNFSKKVPELSFNKVINHFKVSFDIHTEPCFMMTKLSKLDLLYPTSKITQITESFFRKKIKVSLGGKKYFVLSCEDQLAYLFLHLFHHNFRGYNRYHLIDQLIKMKKIDFQKFWHFVHKFNLENYILPGLRMFQLYYPTKDVDFGSNSYHTDSLPKRLNIFEVKTNFDEGIERFVNLFLLSPSPLYKKIFVIFSDQVFSSVARVGIKKIAIYHRSISFLLKTLKYSHNPLPPR